LEVSEAQKDVSKKEKEEGGIEQVAERDLGGCPQQRRGEKGTGANEGKCQPFRDRCRLTGPGKSEGSPIRRDRRESLIF